jgi:hypothetical protein
MMWIWSGLRVNNLHPSIKFTHEKYNTTISFLDTSSSPGDAMSFAKTFLDNTFFVTPSFQMIFKLTQSFFQRFVGFNKSRRLTGSLMKYLTLPFPSSTLLALYRNPQIYTPNLPAPINTFCLATVILLVWQRAYHTVELLESGEYGKASRFVE